MKRRDERKTSSRSAVSKRLRLRIHEEGNEWERIAGWIAGSLTYRSLADRDTASREIG